MSLPLYIGYRITQGMVIKVRYSQEYPLTRSSD